MNSIVVGGWIWAADWILIYRPLTSNGQASQSQLTENAAEKKRVDKLRMLTECSLKGVELRVSAANRARCAEVI